MKKQHPALKAYISKSKPIQATTFTKALGKLICAFFMGSQISQSMPIKSAEDS